MGNLLMNTKTTEIFFEGVEVVYTFGGIPLCRGRMELVKVGEVPSLWTWQDCKNEWHQCRVYGVARLGNGIITGFYMGGSLQYMLNFARDCQMNIAIDHVFQSRQKARDWAEKWNGVAV